MGYTSRREFSTSMHIRSDPHRVNVAGRHLESDVSAISSMQSCTLVAGDKSPVLRMSARAYMSSNFQVRCMSAVPMFACELHECCLDVGPEAV